MKKIQFKNNEAPYLSAENLNQLQNNVEDATQRDITTDGEPVKCGYQIDRKDVYVVRKSFATSSSKTSNSKGITISDLGYEEIINVNGTATDTSGANHILLTGNIALTYDNNNLVIWFNNATAVSYSGYINIYFTKA